MMKMKMFNGDWIAVVWVAFDVLQREIEYRSLAHPERIDRVAATAVEHIEPWN